ncbi:MAG: hypothetical protein ACXWZG_02095 [Microbacterium sp.]
MRSPHETPEDTMGFLDRLFGSDQPQRQAPPVPQNGYAQSGYGQNPHGQSAPPSTTPPKSDDEIAIERYRYLLRTAPPETIEQVHAEAFSKLTEPQRQQVLAELSAGLPPYEQPRSSRPQDLARAATRAEYMNPGFMERTLGPEQGGRQGPGMGSMIGSSILGTVVGYVIGSALVSAFMAPAFADQGSGDTGGDGGADAGGGADASGGADAGWGGDAGGDMGGFGDFGGDFGF